MVGVCVCAASQIQSYTKTQAVLQPHAMNTQTCRLFLGFEVTRENSIDLFFIIGSREVTSTKKVLKYGTPKPRIQTPEAPETILLHMGPQIEVDPAVELMPVSLSSQAQESAEMTPRSGTCWGRYNRRIQSLNPTWEFPKIRATGLRGSL